MAAGAMGKAYDATWGRVFARFYDRALKATEENGLGAMRGELLAEARGRVIEIGAGTGVNLELYGDGVEDLTLVEPDPHMGAQLRKRLADRHGDPLPAQLVAAPAEALPFGDDTFDTAVATLVLCTIPDPVAAIDEMARPAARRPIALHRARPRRGRLERPLAGPPREALALRRRRLPLQPRHRGQPPSLVIQGRVNRPHQDAESGTDRPPADPRHRHPRQLSSHFPFGMRT
jgi:hypothetical protein